MVKTFGNDIIAAYTGGQPVQAIYSYGVQVWPIEPPLPEGYRRVKCIYANEHSGNNRPRIAIDIPVNFDITIDVELPVLDNEFIMSCKGNEVGEGYSYLDINTSSIPTSYRIFINNLGYPITLEDIGRGKFRWINDSVERTAYWNSETFSRIDYMNFSEPAYMYIFRPNYASSYVTNSKIYSIIVKNYSTGDIVKKLVPVLNENTNKAGLFDLINNRFYGNSIGNGSIDYDELTD